MRVSYIIKCAILEYQNFSVYSVLLRMCCSRFPFSSEISEHVFGMMSLQGLVFVWIAFPV